MKTELAVNGQTHALDLDARDTLLDVLRDRVGLTAAKKGCGHGQCGACTVLVDGKRVLSCLTLAVRTTQEVTTSEGLAPDGETHPIQDAFLDHDAYQCGFCTSGQIMSAVAVVQSGTATDRDTVRAAMAGNLCRCSAYPMIVDAVLDGAARMKGNP